jgi:drug/metabolite transporter (DMT)-like permease
MLPYLWMLVSAGAFAAMSEIAGALNARECPWLIVALARTSLALVFTFTLATVQRTPLIFFGPRTLWVRSLTGSVSLLCSFYAFHHLPPSNTIAITNMFPIWVAVLSWPVLGERPLPVVWVAVVCSVAGAILMNGFASGGTELGATAAFVSSVLSAVVVIGLNLLQGVPPQAIVVHFSGIATLFTLAALPQAGVKADDFTSLSPSSIALLVALGLSATVGQIFLTKAFTSGSASKVSVVALSQVVFCALFEFCFLGRRFPWITIVGMILVIGPTAWMMLRRDASKLSAVAVAGNK